MGPRSLCGRLLSLALACLVAPKLAKASLQIVPGATWTAPNTGLHIQAHGGQITYSNGLYYWIGENHQNGSAFQAIPCYSSSDLVQWTFVNNLLTVQGSGDLGPNRVVERPKILYNAATSKWVMWMHIDNSSYGEAKVGVATSSSICGAYTYISSWQPLGFQSRDMSLFEDTNGIAYLLTEDRANGLRIDALSSDYLNATTATYLYAQDYEAPAMIKSNGVYFMFASHESGWASNDNIYCTATSLTGPWSAWQTFAPAGTNTYNSQTAFVLQVGNNFMYMGDRWVSTNLMASTYIWLPLTISGTTASMPTNYVNWVINVSTGVMGGGPGETTYEGESAALSGGAVAVTCSGCSGGMAAGYLGGSAGGVATFSGISSTVSTKTTIRIKYENGDSIARFGSVSVNGGAAQQVAFLPLADGNTPESSVVHVQLNSGAANTFKLSGINGGYVADVDRLMVPIS
ncbi:hypothetical protein FRB96_007212 [Tulasnella sp. 330]|nr:hypothetical protein FRB96_007212 [Tulasnella sp. 330]KAG8871971.1 hypothetical protein FRB97_008129 [Tulasnella sp. 331]KAG8885630.1 hypothetical protein FRB98_001723 [Tulasnella sp. 332]